MREKILDNRLMSIVSLIDKGDSVADIGSDHGYLPLYLLWKNISDKVLVTDIKAGPLASAEKNFSRFGYASKLVTMQYDGIRQDVPESYKTIVIAGMGGLTESGIIKNAADALKKNNSVLILQPMNEIEALREALFEIGYYIEKERRVKTDNGKIYTVIKAVVGNGKAEYLPCEMIIGKFSDCADKDIYIEDLNKKITVLDNIVKNGGTDKKELLERLIEYKKEYCGWLL